MNCSEKQMVNEVFLINEDIEHNPQRASFKFEWKDGTSITDTPIFVTLSSKQSIDGSKFICTYGAQEFRLVNNKCFNFSKQNARILWDELIKNGWKCVKTLDKQTI